MTTMETRTGLLAEVGALLDHAGQAFADDVDVRSALRRSRERLDEPLRVAIAGRVKAGKSTLLNALVGARVAATDAAECTRYVTTYGDGPAYRAFVVDVDGAEHQAAYAKSTGIVDVAGHRADRIDRLRVEFPSPWLRSARLVDTPGLSSLTVDAAKRTRRFLQPRDDHVQADAVIYLMRHLHADDQGFLEAFSDPNFTSASAVNAIALLSRADEIAGGRSDAFEVARRIAAAYESDPAVRRNASVVRPVAALLGLSASTMTQDAYEVFDALAGLPTEVRDRVLLGVDQLREAPLPSPTAEQRTRLVADFGLFGVRLGVALVAHGLAPTASALAGALRQQSGLAELQRLFFEIFSERRHALRARTAIGLVDAALEGAPGEHADLRLELDRLRTNAHELVELRLLEQLRFTWDEPGGRAGDHDRREEIERVIGAKGQSIPRRIGLSDDASVEDQRAAVMEAHRRWRAIESSPTATAVLAAAARVVVRSLERCLARLSEAPAGAVTG